MSTWAKVLVIIGLVLGLLAAPLLYFSDGAKGIIGSAVVFLVLVGLSPLFLIGVWLVHHRRMALASRALDDPELVRGPLGVITHARGSVGRDSLAITRKGVFLDGKTRVALLSYRELKRVAGDREALLRAINEAVARVRAGSLVRGAVAGTTCPYCKDAVAPRESEGTIRCPACESMHHTPCWQEHGGCSVHGCTRVPTADAPSRARTANG